MKHDSATFLDELRRLATNPARGIGSNIHWVGGGAQREGEAVILYRVDGIPSLQGRRYVLETFSAQFDPTVDTAELAWIAFADEISEPSGPGELRDTDWAVNLTPDPSAVRWHG